jgi:hypothetical protein
VEHEEEIRRIGGLMRDADFNSPFSLPTEDLARFYFFNYWCRTGKFAMYEAIHDRIHETSWVRKNHVRCPGKERIAELCYQFRQQIA